MACWIAKRKSSATLEYPCPFYAKHIEDYKYGENWLAYRRPLEGEV